jgi:hypothetical protein
MTATLTSTTPAPTPSTTSTAPSLWKTGLRAGAIAAAATVAVAAGAHAAGVSLETAPGEAIPVLGFGQLTVVFSVVGILIARAIGRRARTPRTTLLRTTLGLTALSLVPDVMLSAGAATKVTLMVTHLVAAAIVIPALASVTPIERDGATMSR